MLPSTIDRVPQHTAAHVNKRIRERMHENISRAMNGGPQEVDRRLAALDREWDIERLLEANAATVVLASFALGHSVDRRFLYLPFVVGGFLLLHALEGWCPPLPLFRRLGVRTAAEIDEERRLLLEMRDRARAASADARQSELADAANQAG
jgi:hypothetical protein